jgi:hypothetical protein
MNVQYKNEPLEGWVKQKAHNWLIHRAFSWLREHSETNLPSELEEKYVQYGVYFADYPWVGRPESFGSGFKEGRGVIGVREDLNGARVDNDCVGIGNDTCVETRFWKRVNLFLSVRVMVSYFFGAFRELQPVDQMAHYPHDNRFRVDGTEGRTDYVVKGAEEDGFRWGVKGDEYATQLYELARHFWSGRDPEPDLLALPKRTPGKVIAGLLGWSPGDKIANATVGSTHLGGNPFISQKNGNATWPIWVPDSYDVSWLTKRNPGRSPRAAAIYLGWALHFLHDFCVPFHAMDELGKLHTGSEDELDSWLQAGIFNHLPVTGYASMGGATEYRFAKREPYWPHFYGELLRPDYCRKFSLDDYGGYSIKSGALVDRFRSAVRTARGFYDDIHPEKRANVNESIAAWEYLMDFALKNTILMVASLRRNAGFSGVVYGRDGSILKNGMVTFVSEDGSVEKQVRTDENGKFVAALKKNGNYSLRVTHPDETPYTNRWFVLERGGFRPLTIRMSDMTPPNGVYGTVRLVVGQHRARPLSGAEIRVHNGVEASDKTNSTGGYKIGIQHPGQFKMTATSNLAKKPHEYFPVNVGEGYLNFGEILMSGKEMPIDDRVGEQGKREVRK